MINTKVLTEKVDNASRKMETQRETNKEQQKYPVRNKTPTVTEMARKTISELEDMPIEKF
jgi:hypothetical protein